MTFIPVNVDDVSEPVAAPIGRYQLQIVEAKITKTGAQSRHPDVDQFRISIGFSENPDFQNIVHFLPIPHEFDDANGTRFKVLLIKRFCELFDIPLKGDGLDTEQLAMEMVGASAFAEVTVGEPNDEGVVYNGLKVPRLRGEPDTRR